MFLLILFSFISLPALAQVERYNSPIVAVGDGSVMTRSQAISKAADKAFIAIAGDKAADEFPAPDAPKAPEAPKPTAPQSPANPASPPSPISKLWPRDTVPIFVTSCSKLRRETLNPCRCIINRLMQKMMHDEFIRLSEANQIDIDPRYLTIRQDCVSEGQREIEQLQQLQQQQQHTR